MDPAVNNIRPTVPAAEHPTAHSLIGIDVWLPGVPPTDCAIELTDGPSYRSRFWRCRACGEERSRPDDFETVCPGVATPAVVTDGGTSTEETERESTSELAVEFVTFGPGYGVVTPDGTRYIVDVEARTCRCDSQRETGEECVHLKRADHAIRTGELPGPDGRYVD